VARTVTVTGHGEASAVPDAALVRVAAVHRAVSLAEALAGAESARAAAVQAAGGLVVTSADLQVWPAHDEHGEPVGFEARHALSVTCDSVTGAGDLLSRLAAEVGDRLRVEGVSLVLADPAPQVAAAREAAVADARGRAEHLAALLSEQLAQVSEVVEGGGGGVAPRMALKAADISLSPGETTLSATVTVTWDLVD